MSITSIENDKTYVIAEAGSNFNSDISIAKKMIEVAAKCGADAVKFQLFKASVLYPNKQNPAHKVVKKCELPREWLLDLYNFAKKQNIDFIASPFDEEAVELLEKIGVVAIKIGSSEVTNLKLLRKVGKTGIPVILSTGMCTLGELADAIEIIENSLCKDITLLHCVSVYPCPVVDVNLRAMSLLANTFKKRIGYSDHTLGTVVPLGAVALGAKVIEKHFTLARSMEGPDHFYALEPDELASMIINIKNINNSLGEAKKIMHSDELKFGRRDGIYASKSIKQGDVFTEFNTIIKRPSLGISSRYFNLVKGIKASKNIKAGSPIFWNDIS